MKRFNLAITSVAAMALMASGCNSQPDWDTDNEQYCVDGDGDMLPMSACDNGGSGGVFMMYGSHYKGKYPSKYKSYSSKMRSSGYYKPSARTSTVSRGSAGATGRSYGGSFGS